MEVIFMYKKWLSFVFVFSTAFAGRPPLKKTAHEHYVLPEYTHNLFGYEVCKQEGVSANYNLLVSTLHNMQKTIAKHITDIDCRGCKHFFNVEKKLIDLERAYLLLILGSMDQRGKKIILKRMKEVGEKLDKYKCAFNQRKRLDMYYQFYVDTGALRQ